MIIFIIMQALTWVSNNFWLLVLTWLSIFGVLILFFVFNSSGRKTKSTSQLPSLTNSYWTLLSVPLKVACLKPNEILPYFWQVVNTIGPLVHAQILTRHYFLINDPEDVKAVLSSAQHITKGPEYHNLEPWLNKGLLTSTGQKWQSRRKLLTNTFHFKVLENYMPSLNDHSRSLVKNLIRASENGEPLAEIDEHVTLCALDIVCETIMGVHLRSQEGKSIDYVNAIKTVTNILIKRIFTFYYWIDFVFYNSTPGKKFRKELKLLHDFTDKIIKERRAVLENSEQKIVDENGKKRVYSFLDLLIGISKENPDTMTDRDIREEVDTFLFEGHDTSSIAITMAIIHLGLDQRMQNLARFEIYKIFSDSTRDATMEDLKAMPYLERVIKETMRLYPSVSGVTRTLNDPLYLKKYTIPAKSNIVIVPHFFTMKRVYIPTRKSSTPTDFCPNGVRNVILTRTYRSVPGPGIA
uniref:Cytochrome p450 n=1 Tax=Sipha flava TaxID=143950 RepID=A0A2S2QDA3_9HEMI